MISAESTPYATRWPFAAYAQAQSGALPGPWPALSRTAMAGMRVGPDGLMQYPPHNTLSRSWRLSSWSANGAPTYIGNGSPIDGYQTGAFSADAFGEGYFQNAPVTAGETCTIAYYIRRTAGTAPLTIGSDSMGQTYATFNPADGTFSAGPAAKGAIALAGGAWLAWVQYTPPTSGNLSILAYVWGASATYEISAWVVRGSALLPHVETDGAARYMPAIEYDPYVSIHGTPYTLTEQFGPELAGDGGFSSPGDWATGSGVSIGSGKLNFAAVAVGTGASKTIAATAGRRYRVILTVSDWSAGSGVWVQIGTGAAYQFTPAANGTFTMLVTATGTLLQLVVNSAGTTLKVDDLSVREHLGEVASAPPKCLGLRVEGVRSQLRKKTDNLSDISVWSRNTLDTPYPVGTYRGRLRWRIRRPGSAAHSQLQAVISTSPAGSYVARLRLWATPNNDTAHVGFYDDGGTFAGSTVTVVSGPGVLSGPSGDPNITGLSQTVPTEIVVRKTVASTQWLAVLIYAAATTSAVVGAELDVQFDNQELGTTPTSFMPNDTTGTALVPADDWLLSDTPFTSAFGDGTDWVLMVEFTAPAYTGILFEMAGASDRGVSNGVCALSMSTGSAIVSFYAAGWGIQGEFSLGALPAAGQRVRIVIAYAANNMRGAMNGAAVVKDTSGAMGGVQGRFKFGSVVGGTTQAQDLVIADALALPGRGSLISDAGLQAMSALT